MIYLKQVVFQMLQCYAVRIQLKDLSQRRIQYRTRWIFHATILFSQTALTLI